MARRPLSVGQCKATACLSRRKWLARFFNPIVLWSCPRRSFPWVAYRTGFIRFCVPLERFLTSRTFYRSEYGGYVTRELMLIAKWQWAVLPNTATVAPSMGANGSVLKFSYRSLCRQNLPIRERVKTVRCYVRGRLDEYFRPFNTCVCT